jgi:hypothetical protein
MRIEVPTPDHLTLTTERNRLLMGLGLLLAAIGLLLGLQLARVTTFSAHRTGPQAGLVRLQQATALKAGTSALLPVRWLDGAQVATHRTPIGWDVYRLVLNVDDGFGPYPLTWHLDQAEARAHAARINHFVGDLEDPSFLLRTDHRLAVWSVAGAVMALGGLFLAAGAQWQQVSFSGLTRTVTIHRRGLWRRGRPVTILFDAVSGFEVAGVSKDSNLFLLRRDGAPLAISLSTDWEAMGGPKRVQAIRRRTAERAEAFLTAAEG